MVRHRRSRKTEDRLAFDELNLLLTGGFTILYQFIRRSGDETRILAGALIALLKQRSLPFCSILSLAALPS